MMMNLLFFLTFIPIYFIDLAMPHVQRKTRVFGVSIPEPFIHDPHLHTLKWGYTKSVALCQLFVIGIAWWLIRPLSDAAQATGFSVGLTVYLLVSFFFYVRFHVRTKRYKADQRWTERVNVVRVSPFETKFEERGNFPHFFFLPSFVITAILFGWGISIYPELPETIPTHWNFEGEPDAWSDKSIGSVFLLVFVMIGIQAMMYGIAYGIFHSNVQVKAQQSEASLQRELDVRKLNAMLLGFINLATVVFMGALFVMSNWNMIYGNETLQAGPFTIAYVVIIFGSIAYAMREMHRLNDEVTEEGASLSGPDQDQYWKGGLFYYNKDDYNLFVEKNVGVGWTINFARPAAWLFIVLTVLLPLLPLFFL